jgi:hypothetical protein
MYTLEIWTETPFRGSKKLMKDGVTIAIIVDKDEATLILKLLEKHNVQRVSRSCEEEAGGDEGKISTDTFTP